MKKIIILFLLSSFTILYGCSASKQVINYPDNTADNSIDNKIDSDNHNDTKVKIYKSQYTGKNISEKVSNQIPFMAVIENSKPSRPQSGLSYADIVYETMAEGGITRFVALFQSQYCDKIGPIRSIRPYLLDLAKEYNLPIAHCGGSEDALLRAQHGNDMNINEMYNGNFFWRDNHRQAPHNLYTSSENIIKYSKENNYIKENNIKFNFKNSYWENEKFDTANEITLKFNRYYYTSYKYNDGNYVKFMDGLKSVDLQNNKPITANNIVIQIADINSINDELHHVNINLLGQGTGYVISSGKYKKMTWSKDNINSQTVIKDENGDTIPLSEGSTWWHIIDKSCIIDIQ